PPGGARASVRLSSRGSCAAGGARESASGFSLHPESMASSTTVREPSFRRTKVASSRRSQKHDGPPRGYRERPPDCSRGGLRRRLAVAFLVTRPRQRQPRRAREEISIVVVHTVRHGRSPLG